jgi:hypothetical protein
VVLPAHRLAMLPNASPLPAELTLARVEWTTRASLLVDVGGHVMVSLRRQAGQRCSGVAVSQVGASLPLPVLPEVLFPARNAEQFNEQDHNRPVFIG